MRYLQQIPLPFETIDLVVFSIPSSFSLPLPGISMFLTSIFWKTLTSYFLLLVLIPLTASFLINFRKSNSAKIQHHEDDFDPITYAVTRALVTYAITIMQSNAYIFSSGILSMVLFAIGKHVLYASVFVSLSFGFYDAISHQKNSRR